MISADNESDTLVPNFQISLFLQFSYQYGVSSRVYDSDSIEYFDVNSTDTPGKFWSVGMDQISPDVVFQAKVAVLTIDNNKPLGFEILADGANNTGDNFILFHTIADNSAYSDNFDGNGHHTIVYSLVGQDKASTAADSGFGSSYNSSTSTASTGGQKVFF